MSPTPLELAEDFTLYLPPRRDYAREVSDGYVLTIGNLYATVVRIRVDDVERAVRAVRERVAGDVESVTWWCGSRATPEDLAGRLLELGLVPDEEDALIVSMVLDRPPAGDPSVEVRRVESFEDFAIAMHIDLAGSPMSRTQKQHRMNRLPQLWETAQEQGAVHYLAYLDGEPVAQARAFFLEDAALLMGATTLPEARGRGAYFALVHTRWREAVARGTPRLVVQAGHMSRPILERVGFRRLGEIQLMVDRL